MDDALFVGRLEGLGDLRSDFESLLNGDGAAGDPLG